MNSTETLSPRRQGAAQRPQRRFQGLRGRELTEKPEGGASSQQGLQAETPRRQLEVGLKATGRPDVDGSHSHRTARAPGLGADGGQALGRETLQHL